MWAMWGGSEQSARVHRAGRSLGPELVQHEELDLFSPGEVPQRRLKSQTDVLLKLSRHHSMQNWGIQEAAINN
jgi:hypothetical protein